MDEKSFKKYLADDGECFEYVVELLLKNMYPSYEFIHTVYNHDGGKDFYSISDNEKIWVEAKCYNRHLELSRIAGTFIMADICQINKMIVFSKSKLTEGAFVNLARYSAMHGKTLVVFNDTDIVNLIRKFKKIPAKKLKKTNIDEIKNQIDALRGKKNGAKCSRLLLVLAQKLFNEFAENKTDDNTDEGVKLLDSSYYLQSNSANPEKLKNNIKAFDIFSAEIMMRNFSLSENKTVEIKFEHNPDFYNLISKPNVQKYVLEPGQCVAAKFYFRAFNKALNIPLPQPVITTDNNSTIGVSTDNIDTYIDCRIIGETSYLGIDRQNLDQLNIDLNAPNRAFTPVMIYGKSGVGKSRFLYELKNARMRSGNQCFLFGGDIRCNSISDLMRQLLLGYYNFYFDETTGKIILPQNIKEFVKSNSENSIKFICDAINNREDKFDAELARKWFVAFLKNNNATIMIDNAQNLNEEMFAFVNRIISDLQVCVCNSELVLAFNTDNLITTAANKYYKYYLNSVPREFTYKLVGFDVLTAVDYLKLSLDPYEKRGDITELCTYAVKRIETNPLFLKQIVLYLFQKQIIGFYNETICFKSLDVLKIAINDLPENIHSAISYRFDLLVGSIPDQKRQIDDLFWAILIFGEFPLLYSDYIADIKDETVRKCVELGFLKYGENNTLIFEHQMIAKSILIILQGDEYHSNPAITKIGLSKATAKNISENLFDKRYAAIKFIVEECAFEVTCDAYNLFLSNLHIKKINLLLIPYIVHIIDEYNHKFNGYLNHEIVVNALWNTITVCQDRLGVDRTCFLFENLINYHLENYLDYRGQAKKFIEILKYYMYELQPKNKTDFISKLNDVGKKLLNGEEKSDFELWIYWAQGKNLMSLHNFESAFETLMLGAKKAKEAQNFHRIAGMEAQLGYLGGFLEDKAATIKHWEEASKYFNGSDIYDKVQHLIYAGQTKLIKGDYASAEDISNELLTLYNDNGCYAYLKAVINDFTCNYLIRKAVQNIYYDADLDNQIKAALSTFRAQALVYKSDVYLRAAYKTIVYYKFIIENFAHKRTESDNSDYMELIYVLGEELLSNYDWENSDFTFFYPVFKDIVEIAGTNSNIMQYFGRLPTDKKVLFENLAQNCKTSPVFLPKPKRGVLSDKDQKVNLFHYSYTW